MKRAAVLIWGASLLLARLIGLVRERALGVTLGAGPEADVYQAAFRVPDLINYLVAGGALSIVFIPLFTAHLERKDTVRAWRTFSVIANFLVLLLGGLPVAGEIWMPVLVGWLAPGFTEGQLEQLCHLSRIILPAQMFHLIGGLLGASLLAQEKHAAPALAPLIYTVPVIAGGLLSGSAEGFAWGTLVGAILGPFGVPLWAALRSGLQWTAVLDLRDSDFRTYLVRSLPIMLGWSIVGMDESVTTWFASALGDGQVALLGYARSLMRVPMSVFGVALGMASYPALSRLCVDGKNREAWALLTTATRQALLLAFGAQVVLSVAGPDLAALVYSARKISPERIEELGTALLLFSLALSGWTVQPLLSRGFYAQGRTWLPTWLGFGVLILALPLYALGSARLGTAGLALASSTGIMVYTLLLAVILGRSLGVDGPAAGYAAFFARLLPATAVSIAGGLWARALWHHGADGALSYAVPDALLRAVVIGGAGGAVFAGLCWISGVQEIREIADKVLRRLRRNAIRA